MKGRLLRMVAGLLLAALTVAVYLPVVYAPFFVADDGDYVTNNPQVLGGVTGRGVVWAFTAFHSANWHPLTWLSHMVDCQLFGLEPAGHHAVNLALHAVNTLLVLAFLALATGSFWRAWVTALVFGVHPLHVESVAWVAERKDVLSTFFALLALVAYVVYVRGQRGRWYWVSVGLTACSLLSKPMWVTMPCVLLLLDYWPLGRAAGPEPMGRRMWWRLVLEKWPWWLLTLGSAVVTVLAQARVGAVKSVEQFGIGQRLGNALASYVTYVGKALYPVDLAVFYPHQDGNEAMTLIMLVMWAGTVVALAVWQRARRPQLLVGLLWFAGMLVPVIGLVQVGSQALADRYMYVPLVGLTMAVVWSLPGWERQEGWARALGWPGRVGRVMLGSVACVWLAWLPLATYVQCRYWMDPLKLLGHTKEVTRTNYRAMEWLGVAWLERHQPELAVGQLQSATNQPARAQPWVFLGQAYEELGREAEAEGAYCRAIEFNPRYGPAYLRLGMWLRRAGRHDEALGNFRRAAELAPGDASAQQRLGMALFDANQVEEALGPLRRAVELRPEHAGVHVSLGLALARLRRYDEAEAMFRRALELDPRVPEAAELLEKVLGRKREAERGGG